MRHLLAAWRVLPWVAAVLATAVAFGLYGCVVVAGGSMAPAIRPGDVLVYRRAPVRVAPGDVAVLHAPGWSRPVVHRIASVDASGAVTTRGDANARVDVAPMPPEAVRGRGELVVPLSAAMARLARLPARARLLLQSNSAKR
jgi:signal peptidase